MIPGGSNDKRLTDVDTCKCYMCKVAQYLTYYEALLHAFTYALVYIYNESGPDQNLECEALKYD